MNGSPRFRLNRDDLASIGRGALLAAAGAVVTYLATEVLPHLDQTTVVGAVVAGIASTLINAIRKYVSDTR